MCLSLGSSESLLFIVCCGLDRSDSLQSGEETAGGSDVVGRPSMSERAEARAPLVPAPDLSPRGHSSDISPERERSWLCVYEHQIKHKDGRC